MAKEANTEEIKRIPVEEIKLGEVYQTYVKDLVKILKIDGETKTITLYNISGAHKQWVAFNNIFLVKKL